MNKVWFPQQNNADSLPALLKSFIHHIEFPVSRQTIEKDVQEYPGFPVFSFESVSKILEKWGLKSVIYNCNWEHLKEIPSPSLLFINEVEENTKVGGFVMFYGMRENTVEYLHSRKGWVLEPKDLFEKKWAKVALSLTEATSEGELDFEEKEKQYAEKKSSNPELKNILFKTDFLSDEECDYIISLAETNFKRSRVMADKKEEQAGRTSYSAELVFPQDEKLNIIRKRASDLLKFPESHFEFFQCVSYEAGQEYQNHYDTFDQTIESGKIEVEKNGQRKYTMLVYLNDDFVGGGTYFPNLDLLVLPKKRSVVVFNNLDENGQVIKAAFHAGLPVTTGRKYAINMWVRNKPLC